MKRFVAKEGSRVNGDPQKIGEELERIRKAEGKLTTESVVERARPKASPLHKEFVWDDTEAARRFRMVQASTLIRSIAVIVDDRPPVSQYVHVTTEKVRRYEPMAVAVQDVDSYHSALEMLMEKLSGAARAVNELREAAGSSKYKTKLVIINLIAKALETATAGIKKLAA